MEECPVCLEPLSGTVVQLGCCKKCVHIQCYVTKCPLCRSDLLVPTHAVEHQHVIVQVHETVKHIQRTPVFPGIIRAAATLSLGLYPAATY